METRSSPDTLTRQIGLFGATMLGLGSILGTGIFVSIGIAAGAAGPGVLISIALAAALATCNALSSAQLAAAHPVSGGTYEHGYRLLSPRLGFTAGWMFLCAKSASAAAAALGAAGYGLHLAGLDAPALLRWVGLGLVLAFTGLVLSGLRRSSIVNTAIVSVTLIALSAFVIAGLVHLLTTPTNSPFTPLVPQGGDLSGILYASALMFVAFTGYGRIATLGEEVTEPRRTIPVAIIVTLAVSALLYMGVAVAAIGAVGAPALAVAGPHAATPLETAAQGLGAPGLGLLVALGAVTAMLGVLLNLILGLSRVALAMGRRGDLPRRFARLTPDAAPHAAVLLVGAAIAGLAMVGNVATIWAFSALTVLVYYAITNLAALRLPPRQRLYPRWISAAGLAGCLALSAFIPIQIWAAGAVIAAAGFALRFAVRRRTDREA